jgi:hypothetical protein
MPYSYGANNPVTMTDPSGLFPCFGICDLAQAAWQMTATTVVYEYDVARRYANDPGQAVKDVVTGTAFAEQAWAGINIRAGATLKRDGEYCSGAANCFVNGLSPKDATTIGHTEAYSDAKPGDALIAHETQHVFDVEDHGAFKFYSDYLGESAWRWLSGNGDPYNDLWAERRAYYVSEHYKDGYRPQHGGNNMQPLSGKINESGIDKIGKAITNNSASVASPSKSAKVKYV